MEITDRAMSNLSFALGLTENTDANTLMLNAAVRINRLSAELETEKKFTKCSSLCRCEDPYSPSRKQAARDILEIVYQHNQWGDLEVIADSIKETFALEI